MSSSSRKTKIKLLFFFLFSTFLSLGLSGQENRSEASKILDTLTDSLFHQVKMERDITSLKQEISARKNEKFNTTKEGFKVGDQLYNVVDSKKVVIVEILNETTVKLKSTDWRHPRGSLIMCSEHLEKAVEDHPIYPKGQCFKYRDHSGDVRIGEVNFVLARHKFIYFEDDEEWDSWINFDQVIELTAELP